VIGEPGKRTFRLVAERGATTVSLWLEKEQLQSVAVLVEQHLASSGRAQVRQERALLTLAARFPGKPTVDFKAGRMSLGYDQRKETFAVAAEEIAETDARGQQVSWEMGVAQARALCAKIAEIVAAGRPRCPLCGAPMDGKHVCPLSNGHAH
jgi:uncharacterized repeat protein (TIGR03847 family)